MGSGFLTEHRASGTGSCTTATAASPAHGWLAGVEGDSSLTVATSWDGNKEHGRDIEHGVWLSETWGPGVEDQTARVICETEGNSCWVWSLEE